MNRYFLTSFWLKGEILEGAACLFKEGSPNRTVPTPHKCSVNTVWAEKQKVEKAEGQKLTLRDPVWPAHASRGNSGRGLQGTPSALWKRLDQGRAERVLAGASVSLCTAPEGACLLLEGKGKASTGVRAGEGRRRHCWTQGDAEAAVPHLSTWDDRQLGWGRWK